MVIHSGPVGWMWRSMAGQGKYLAAAALVGSVASICAVALVGTAAWLIATAAGMPPVLTLTVAAVAVRFFALGRAVFRYVERLVGHDAAFRGLTALRVQVYARLERIAPVGLARYARGDLLTRLVADVDAALDLPLRVVLPWIQAGLVLAACVAGLAWLVPAAAGWLLLLGLIALLAAPWLASALALRAERQVAPQRSELAARVVTSLAACADLLAYGAVGQALRRISQTDRSLTALQQRESFALGLGGGQVIVLQGLAVTGALAIGAPAVASGTLSGPWLAVIVLAPLALFDVLGTLPAAALSMHRLRGSAERLAELEQAPEPFHPPTRPARWIDPPTAATPAIAIDGLAAAWSPGGQRVLHEVSFTLPAGSHLAIVGPSGSGKSTLIAVLMGFLDYAGSVRIGGNEVRDVEPDELRQRIGLLAQRSHVFDTTIEENIRLGRRVDDPAELWRALEWAHLADFVRSLPAGLRTCVGAFGRELSGGQAQRLCIARIMLQPPPILLLDEPTEHLDAVVASRLQATLDRLASGRTRVLITHAVSLIHPDDHVLVLDSGRVVQAGQARELAAGEGWFARQWARERAQTDLAMLLESLPRGIGVPAPS